MVAIAYWPRDFDRPPKPSGLRAQYLTRDPRETKLAVIDTVILAYNANVATIAMKIRLFKIAFVLMSSATALLAVAVVVQVIYQTTPLNP